MDEVRSILINIGAIGVLCSLCRANDEEPIVQAFIVSVRSKQRIGGVAVVNRDSTCGEAGTIAGKEIVIARVFCAGVVCISAAAVIAYFINCVDAVASKLNEVFLP